MAMLGGVLRSWRRRRDIAGYARRLPRQLRRDHGPAPSYTPAQVRSSIGRAGLNQDNSCYALAMYTDPADFAADHAARGEVCDYDAMRAEVAEVHFGGGDLPSADQLCADAAPGGGSDAGSGGWDGSGDARGGSDTGGGSDSGGSDSGGSSSDGGS